MTKDVVCGVDVEESSPWFSEIEGKRFVFCGQHCKQKFEQHPTAYTLAEQEWRATDEGMPEPYQIPENLI